MLQYHENNHSNELTTGSQKSKQLNDQLPLDRVVGLSGVVDRIKIGHCDSRSDVFDTKSLQYAYYNRGKITKTSCKSVEYFVLLVTNSSTDVENVDGIKEFGEVTNETRLHRDC